MRRLALFLVMLFVFAGAAAVGCKKNEAAKSEESKKDVGIKDFIDYATGKAPIERGREIRKRLRDIQAERDEKAREVMGE